MLASPVSFAGRLEQYIGRLNRDYEGKTEVIVYDYIDSHIRYFDNMYAKRLRTYKRTGFDLIADTLVSSPELTQDKIERFIYLLKPRQEAGVDVTVITTEPENIPCGSTDF